MPPKEQGRKPGRRSGMPKTPPRRTLQGQKKKKNYKAAKVNIQHAIFWRYLYLSIYLYLGFPGGSEVKKPPAYPEDMVQFLSQEDPLEKEMATHSSILA